VKRQHLDAELDMMTCHSAAAADNDAGDSDAAATTKLNHKVCQLKHVLHAFLLNRFKKQRLDSRGLSVIFGVIIVRVLLTLCLPSTKVFCK